MTDEVERKVQWRSVFDRLKYYGIALVALTVLLQFLNLIGPRNHELDVVFGSVMTICFGLFFTGIIVVTLSQSLPFLRFTLAAWIKAIFSLNLCLAITIAPESPVIRGIGSLMLTAWLSMVLLAVHNNIIRNRELEEAAREGAQHSADQIATHDDAPVPVTTERKKI